MLPSPDGKIVAIGADDTLPDGNQTIDATGLHILPGLIDAHVHFRDPGVTHKEDFSTGSTAAVCGGITTIIDMPNQIPPTENAEQVGVKRKIAEAKSLCDFAVLGVVHQTNADDILPMAKRGAIGYKIFFGETIGNLPFPDDGMCQIVFPNITKSGVPLCVHAENRQIQHFWTNKLKAEGKNDPIYWESSRPWLCEAESIAHIMFLAENFRHQAAYRARLDQAGGADGPRRQGARPAFHRGNAAPLSAAGRYRHEGRRTAPEDEPAGAH